MAGVNKAIIVGNLGRDPEVRTMPSGDRMVTFSVATSETWKDRQSGERREKTEWHNIAIFNEHLVRVAEQYLRKGSKVYLEGAIQTRTYTDRDGNERRTTEIVLPRFRGELQMLDGRGEGGSGGGGGSYGGGSRGGSQGGGGGGRGGRDNGPSESYDLDDEIPF